MRKLLFTLLLAFALFRVNADDVDESPAANSDPQGPTSGFVTFEDPDETTSDSKTYLVRPKNKGQLKKLLKDEDAIFLDNLEWVILKNTDKLPDIKGEIDVLEKNFYLTTTQAATPNDPLFSSQWGLNTIQAVSAWNVTTGASDVIVGIVDSGIDFTHPDLVQNLWVGPNGENGYAAAGGVISTNTLDEIGHGTHVAGVIGASVNNSIGVAGINWNVKIASFRFLDKSGSGLTSDALVILNKVLSLKQSGVNVRVLNNSWGGSNYSQALSDAFLALENAGIISICSAGNTYFNGDLAPAYPASYPHRGIVSVQATTSSDLRAVFSTYGYVNTDISAPGENIISTVPLPPAGLGDLTGYKSMSGTSMAAPHVSAAAALLLSINPNLTVYQLRDILLDPNSLDQKNFISSTGGRLNLNKLVNNPKVTSVFQLNSPPTITTFSFDNLTVNSGDPFFSNLEAVDADSDPINKFIIISRSDRAYGWLVGNFLQDYYPDYLPNGVWVNSPKSKIDLTLRFWGGISDGRGGSTLKSSYVNFLKTPNFTNSQPTVWITTEKSSYQIGEVGYATVNISDPEDTSFYGYLIQNGYGYSTASYSRFVNGTKIKLDTSKFQTLGIRAFVIDPAFNLVESPKVLVNVGGSTHIPPNLVYSISSTNGVAPLTVQVSYDGTTSGTFPIYGYSFMPASDWYAPWSGKTYTYTFNTPGIYSVRLGVLTTNPSFYSDSRYIIVNVKDPQGVSPTPLVLAPSGLVASGISQNQIKLSWTDNANNETQQIIERSQDGVNFSQLIAVGAGVVTYTDFGLSPNTTYFYKVKATNSSAESLYSGVSSAKTWADYTLNPVTDLSGVLVGSQAQLKWTDTSINEQSWQVYGGKVGRNGQVSYSLLATLPANSSSYNYSLPNLKFGYSFYVRSAAYSQYAPNSNIVTLK